MSRLYQNTGGFFKHTHTFSGYADGTPYLYYKDGGGIIDGINRQHINLYGKCDTCSKEVLVAKIHVDEYGTLYGTIPKNIKPYVVKRIDELTAYICSIEKITTGDKVLSAQGPNYGTYNVFTIIDKPDAFRGKLAGICPDVNNGKPVSLNQYSFKIAWEVENLDKVKHNKSLDRNDFEVRWVNTKGISSITFNDVDDEDEPPVLKAFIK